MKRRPTRGCVLLLTLLCCMLDCCFGAPTAWAQSSRVAIVRPPAGGADIREATVRLSAEIRAAGFDVVLLDAKPNVEARQQVEQTGLRPPAFATIAITPTDQGAVADVWVADHLSDKTSVRRLKTSELDTQAGSEVPRALAIQAVELLRASLLEVAAQPTEARTPLPDDVARWMREGAGVSVVPTPAPATGPPTTGPTTGPPTTGPPTGPPPAQPLPPAGAVAIQRPEQSRSARPAGRTPVARPRSAAPSHRSSRSMLYSTPTIELSPGLLAGAVVSSAFAPTLRVSFPLPSQWFGRVTLAGTLVPNLLRGRAGEADIRQEMLTLGFGYAFRDADDIFTPLITAAVGAYHLGATGRAVAPYQSQSDSAWAFAASGGLGLAARLSDHFALIADARAVVALPQARLRLGIDDAGAHGAPLFYGTFGALAAF